MQTELTKAEENVMDAVTAVLAACLRPGEVKALRAQLTEMLVDKQYNTPSARIVAEDLRSRLGSWLHTTGAGERGTK